VHAPSEEKSVEELEQVFFYHFSKYHMKILLGDFNAKVGEREYLQTDNWE
jgi:endonuclease/exonuclease/phosphatase family metal-dependent hydrolase